METQCFLKIAGGYVSDATHDESSVMVIYKFFSYNTVKYL